MAREYTLEEAIKTDTLHARDQGHSEKRRNERALNGMLIEETLNGSSAEDIYNRILGEMASSNDSDSPTASALYNQVNGLTQQATDKAIDRARQQSLSSGITLSPEEEEKLRNMFGWVTDGPSATAFAHSIPREGDNVIQADVHRNIAETVANDPIQLILNREIGQLRTETPDAVADLAASIVPFQTGTAWYRVMKEVLPQAVAKGHVILPGEALVTIKDKLVTLQKTDKRLFQNFFEEVVDAINKHAGFTGENDYIAFTMLNEVAQSVRQGADPDAFDWDRLINNAVGILDVVGAGQIVGRVLRGARQLLSNRTDRLARMAPESMADKMARAALDPTDSSAKALGFKDKHDMFERAMPLPDLGDYDSLPGGIASIWTRAAVAVSRMKEQLRTNMHYTEAEKTLAVENIKATIKASGSSTLWLNKSVFTAGDEGIEVTAVYGQGVGFGYRSFTEAKNAAERLFPKQEYTIVKRNLSTGDLVRTGEHVEVVGTAPLTARPRIGARVETPAGRGTVSATSRGSGYIEVALDTAPESPGLFRTGTLYPVTRRGIDGDFVGDFAIQVKSSYGYSKDSVGARNLMFGKGDTNMFGAAPFQAAGWVLDADSLYSRFIAGGANTALDQAKGFEEELRFIMKPFSKLNRKGKLKILSTLENGDDYGRVFTVDDLRARGFTIKEMEGYYSVRATYQAVWDLENAKLGNELAAQGFGRLSFKAADGGDVSEFVRPLRADETIPDHPIVYDPETSTVTRVPAAEALSEGYKFGRLHQPFDDGTGKMSDWIIYHPSITEMKPLPYTVLKHKPGFIPRLTQNTHYVVFNKKNATLNGGRVPHRTAIYAFSSARKAEVARKMAESEVDFDSAVETLEVVRRDKLRPEQQRQFELQLMRDEGWLGRGTVRGTPISDLALSPDAVEDPLRALSKAIQHQSNFLAHDDWIQSMKTRWMNTYGETHAPRDAFGRPRMPDTSKDLEPGLFSTTRNKAANMLDYIRHMESNNTATAEWWTKTLFDLGDFIEEMNGLPFRNGVARYLRGDRKDPFQVVRGLTFDAFLALAPARQLLLQSMQAMYIYPTAPLYVGSGRLFSELASLIQGSKHFHDPAKFAQVAKREAEWLGMTEREFTNLVRGWKQSGMEAAIDQNELARESFSHLQDHLSRNRWVDMGQTAFDWTYKRPVGVARRFGFDAGERLNMMQTFLVARHRWIRNNPGKDFTNQVALQEIAGDTRSMALSMTKAGQLKYQRGVFSTMFQFASIMHKATLGYFTNKTFTRREKAGIFLTQLGLYGEGVLPMFDGMVQWAEEEMGLDLGDTPRGIIRDGLLEHFINEVLSTEEEPAGLNISDSLAPSSGAGRYVEDTLTNILTNPAYVTFFGPSASYGKRLDQTIQFGKWVWQTPGLSTEDQILRSAKAISSIGSGFSSYFKFQAARNFGVAASSSGTPMAQAAAAEAWAKLFGFEQKDVTAAYELMYSPNLQNLRATKEEVDQHADNDARMIMNNIRRVVTMFEQTTPEGNETAREARIRAFGEEIQLATGFIMNTMDPPYREQVKERLARLFAREMAREEGTVKESLIDQLLKISVNNHLGGAYDTVLKRLENEGFFKTDKEKTELELMWATVTTGRELGSEE